MRSLEHIVKKNYSLAIGLMSGTCTDGVDAALVSIKGHGINTKVELIDFISIPYESNLRNRLLEIATGDFGGSKQISQMDFFLGHLFGEACLSVCRKAGIKKEEIDFIGNHGHTIYHQPNVERYFDFPITSTFQIGQGSVIAERMGCMVVEDFRVRDMAAGGQGAPLVPYTEYLLFSEPERNIALQNIGGIGNITYLRAGGLLNEIVAFDTGPGNMVIDALVSHYTNQKMKFDRGGQFAARGQVEIKLLEWMLRDEYLMEKPPKTTGREKYGEKYVKEIIKHAETNCLPMENVITTATMFTAIAIEKNVKYHLPSIPEQIIIGGGGSKNSVLLSYIQDLLKECNIVTNEDLGLNSDAKEAIAFAILANETLHGNCNNVPSATGADHGVVMGKIIF